MCKLVIRRNRMSEKNRNVSCFMLGFQRIFINIRSQIRNPYNISLLEQVSKYCLKLKDEDAIEFELFRIEIYGNVSSDLETYEFLENALKMDCISYVTDNLGEISRYLSVLSDAALEICALLRQENFERAYDLVDAIHCLPEAIMSKKQWNSKAFWKIYIKPYREKWDNNFLSIQEKQLVKAGISGMFQ